MGDMTDSAPFLIEADPKRGSAKATAVLKTGNAIIYAAKDLHRDRLNREIATVEVAFCAPGAERPATLAYTDLDLHDSKDRVHLANQARKHLQGPKDGALSEFEIDLME